MNTMTEDRISRYLAARAAALDLPPGELDAVVRRAGRRRRHRRALAAAAAVAVVGVSAAVVLPGDDPRPTDVAVRPAGEGGEVVASPLDWSVVEASSGLGFVSGPGTVAADDGAVYALSTAPGVREVESPRPPATLYRSADGAEWSPVALPADFWPAAVASAGERVYAVGTAPAGGGVTDRLATSADGGATWETLEVGSGLADLLARHPGELLPGTQSVAVHDGTVVVTATVHGDLDLESRVPGGLPADGHSVEITADGVVVTPAACGDGWAVPRGADPRRPEVDEAGPPPGPPPSACDPEAPAQPATYTWDELGVDDELRDIVLHGRTLVAVSAGGDGFTPVDLGDGLAGGIVVAGDDGFTLFAVRGGTPGSPDSATTEVHRSADGVSWTPAGELDGRLMSAGVVDGRPAAAVADLTGGAAIWTADGSGGWWSVDPRTAVDDPETSVSTVAFGPLGWAAVVNPPVDEHGGRAWRPAVVHSLDGRAISTVPLDELVDPADLGGLDVSVTADAVLVRVTAPDDGDPGAAPVQRVVVGTPPD
ncbi:MAG: hypothetical protein FWJ72_10985 [Acidimicrobiia bacterium]